MSELLEKARAYETEKTAQTDKNTKGERIWLKQI